MHVQSIRLIFYKVFHLNLHLLIHELISIIGHHLWSGIEISLHRMSKRLSPESDDESADGFNEPMTKKRHVEFEPIRICSVTGTVDIDAKVLTVQHYKLSERFRLKEKQKDQLQKRVEQLENRQAQDDAMLCIINRSWNKFDEEVRILLQRFDSETSIDEEILAESKETKSFLANLSHWESDEMEEKLQQRVDFSRRALGKLVQVFDRLMQRNEKIAKVISKCTSITGETNEGKFFVLLISASTSRDVAISEINEEIVSRNGQLSEENVRLQKLVTKLQEENYRLSTKVAAQEDELIIMETRKEEMSNSLEEVKYELEKSMRRECKLDYRLADYARKVQKYELNEAKNASENGLATHSSSNTTSINKSKLEDLEQSLEMERELAANRLQEAQELHEENKKLTREVDSLSSKLKHIPTEIIKGSVEYTALQNQFTNLFVEATQMRKQLETARSQMASLRAAHAKQIEHIENEAYLAQQRMKDTVGELDEQLSQVRREYEMLRLEFEQNLAANEQSNPANKETRIMLSTYKTQNQQLKQESNRFKRKWKEAVASLAKANKELEGEKRYRERCLLIEIEEDSDSLASPDPEKNSTAPVDPFTSDSTTSAELGEALDGDTDSGAPQKTIQKLRRTVVELQSKLDCLNSLSSEQRSRIELLARDRRQRLENEKLQAHLKKLVGADRREKMRYYSEEAQRKIRSLEELNERLRKEAHSARQEEEGLTNEVETTGQAFEEMQEKNALLIQQLKEKDEANLKLMTERIRANQFQKKMNEEKERIEERVISLQNQLDAQMLMLRKVEEREKLQLQKNSTMEQQLRIAEQGLEEQRRKALDSERTSSDLKAQLEKCSGQLADAQLALTSKKSQEADIRFNLKRLEEDRNIFKKKYERSKKLEKVDNLELEQVLNEEIRELKDLLTCPSCKMRRKDAVLTKCFHVFCMECMKTRYETRRRKCPKCNAAFGANDYRRLYM
uniref:E3 ubiquitin protein ligase n=1 Tax=Syphacia muris TaxID=451379 RepID=A0A0N5AMT2_9BILA